MNLRSRIDQLEKQTLHVGVVVFMEDEPGLEEKVARAERQGAHVLVISFVDAKL